MLWKCVGLRKFGCNIFLNCNSRPWVWSLKKELCTRKTSNTSARSSKNLRQHYYDSLEWAVTVELWDGRLPVWLSSHFFLCEADKAYIGINNYWLNDRMNLLKEAKTPTALAKADGFSADSLSPPLSNSIWPIRTKSSVRPILIERLSPLRNSSRRIMNTTCAFWAFKG